MSNKSNKDDMVFLYKSLDDAIKTCVNNVVNPGEGPDLDEIVTSFVYCLLTNAIRMSKIYKYKSKNIDVNKIVKKLIVAMHSEIDKAAAETN